MQQEVDEEFASLEKRIRQLIGSHAALQATVQELRNELKVAQIENERLRVENDHFRNREKMNNIVTSLTERNPESEQLKLKLDGYLRVIDKCIKHINNT